MIRVPGWVMALFVLLLLSHCGGGTSPKCQPSNCSGCCSESGECLGVMKQSEKACGTAGVVCRA